MIWNLLKRKKKKLHIIGDSHVLGLEKLGTLLPQFEVILCSVSGATASGLQNPHSQTLAGPILNEYITNNVKTKDHVMVHLGEVDVGFLMWVRSERNGISIEEQMESTLANYFDLLDKILKITPALAIISIIPQTIKDGSKIENVANLRGQIKATQLERTKLSFKMNARLKEFAKLRKIVFLDLDSELVDPSTGIVKDKFLNSNPQDHHLNSSMLVELVAKHYTKVLSNR